jgi:DNA-binding helix-hairpin-helix protein with protein kinase domain
MQPSEKPKEVEAVVLKSFLDMPPLEDRPSLAERVAKLEAKVEVLEAGAVTMRNGETWQLIRLTRCPHCEQDTRDRYHVIEDTPSGRLVWAGETAYCADCGQVKR